MPDMFQKYPDCVDVLQLKKMLGIGKNSAYRLLESGAITHRRIGKKYLIPKICIIEYLYGKAQ